MFGHLVADQRSASAAAHILSIGITTI